jgi:hypothetical protein
VQVKSAGHEYPAVHGVGSQRRVDPQRWSAGHEVAVQPATQSERRRVQHATELDAQILPAPQSASAEQFLGGGLIVHEVPPHELVAGSSCRQALKPLGQSLTARHKGWPAGGSVAPGQLAPLGPESTPAPPLAPTPPSLPPAPTSGEPAAASHRPQPLDPPLALPPVPAPPPATPPAPAPALPPVPDCPAAPPEPPLPFPACATGPSMAWPPLPPCPVLVAFPLQPLRTNSESPTPPTNETRADNSRMLPPTVA